MPTATIDTAKDLYTGPMRLAWALPRQITVSEWADAHRILDARTSAEPGQWRTSRTPYLRGIMDAFCDRHVQDIVMMLCTQVGKTEAMLNMLGYAADEDPGPALWVGPGETLVKQFCYERIQPMFNLSTDLFQHLFSTKREDFNKRGIALDHMNLHFGWAGSPASLAARAIRYLFMDEIDKNPAFAGREADPIDLATERTKTFWNRKIVKCSTPTTKDGYIWREYHKTDQLRYFVPCPHCGKYQTLIFGQLKFTEDQRDPQAVLDGRLAWYECAACFEKIYDAHKQKMLDKGVWAPVDAKIDAKGNIKPQGRRSTRTGFWLNAIYSPWLTFADVAAKFLSSKDDPAKLMNFVNSWLSEPFDEKEKETDEVTIRMLSVDYPEGLVPDPVMVLTAGVDVQEGHFYASIRGWGVGAESWLIRAGRIESWPELIEVLFNTQYAKRDGEALSVRMAAIDTGYKTDEVYEFVRRFPDRARAVKGRDTLNGIPYSAKHIDKFPNGRIIKGGLMLWHLDVSFFKDKIHRLLHPETLDQASWHIYSDPSDDYVRQMCSEHKILERNRRRKDVASSVWRLKTSAMPNHYWDCEVYNLALADMLRIHMLKSPGQSGSNVYRPRTGGGSQHSGWLGQKSGWVKN